MTRREYKLLHIKERVSSEYTKPLIELLSSKDSCNRELAKEIANSIGILNWAHAVEYRRNIKIISEYVWQFRQGSYVIKSYLSPRFPSVYKLRLRMQNANLAVGIYQETKLLHSWVCEIEPETLSLVSKRVKNYFTELHQRETYACNR